MSADSGFPPRASTLCFTRYSASPVVRRIWAQRMSSTWFGGEFRYPAPDGRARRHRPGARNPTGGPDARWRFSGAPAAVPFSAFSLALACCFRGPGLRVRSVLHRLRAHVGHYSLYGEQDAAHAEYPRNFRISFLGTEASAFLISPRYPPMFSAAQSENMTPTKAANNTDSKATRKRTIIGRERKATMIFEFFNQFSESA